MKRFESFCLLLLSLSVAESDDRWSPGCQFSRDQLSRSYSIPQRFPFPPIRLVMETRAAACDLFADHDFCQRFQADGDYEPCGIVREAIGSFLVGCHQRPCHVMDLGANLGWFSAYILSLGAHLVAIEPQSDLVSALRETVELNCWSERAEVIHGFVSPQSSEACAKQAPVSAPSQLVPDPGSNLTMVSLPGGQKLWREGGHPQHLSLASMRFVSLDELLLKQRTWELVKIDVDSVEPALMSRIDQLLWANRVDIQTIILESNGCSASLMKRLQQGHGYHIYLLDIHVDIRFIDARGLDVYRGFIPAPGLHFLEEMYSIRLMRHVYYFKPNMTLYDWSTAIRIARFGNQYLLTKVPLLEPRREHPLAIIDPSTSRQLSGYNPPADGIGTEARPAAIYNLVGARLFPGDDGPVVKFGATS